METKNSDSSASGSTTTTGTARRRRHDKPYKGIRQRKWGKWVAEIREPNKRSRIWLGSYCTAVAAARAYDTAVFYLRGPTAKLNFPDEVSTVGVGMKDLSASSIRKMAAEVGARVDAMETGFSSGGEIISHDELELGKPAVVGANWFHDHQIDLNKKPEPEDQDWS